MLNRVLAVTVLLLIPKVALPQAVTSSIVGTVRDSSGALMAGARVKVTNTGATSYARSFRILAATMSLRSYPLAGTKWRSR
jgi:hypothetical protein